MDGWLERHRHILMMALSALVLSGAAVWLLRRPPTPPGPVLQIATAPPTPTLVPTLTPAPLRVYVSGSVAHPDVYRLPLGSIVQDALSAAGGALPEADLVRVNLAQQLSDQQHVHIPETGEALLPAEGLGRAQSLSSSGACLDINQATVDELDELPGIGPAYAQRIVDYRATHGPFPDVDALDQVKGIGPAILEEIRDRICVP